MGKLIAIAALVGAGWWALQHGLVPVPAGMAPASPAYQAYVEFSKLLAHDHYGSAKQLAARGAIRAVQVRELTGRRNTRLGISGSKLAKDVRESAAKGEVTAVSHELVSERPSADGQEVRIEAIARVCRAQIGCESFRQDVEACLIDGVWKVCSFHESRAPDADLASR